MPAWAWFAAGYVLGQLSVLAYLWVMAPPTAPAPQVGVDLARCADRTIYALFDDQGALEVTREQWEFLEARIKARHDS